MFNKYKNKTTIITMIFLVIVFVFLMPFIWFGLGALVGLLLKVTIGNLLVTGFSLFNIDIVKSDLPIVCGTLAIIASFFKNSVNIDKNKG